MVGRPLNIEMPAQEDEVILEQPSENIFVECINTIKRLVGIPHARRLSHHAACKHHEDVPDTAIEQISDEQAGLRIESRVDSVIAPDFEAKCPARLRPLLPPANFGAVVPDCIYRSSFPLPENFGFLKSLGLKTILTLVPGPYPQPHVDFMLENGIQHFQVHIPANKQKIAIDSCQMTRALKIVLDRSNHPMLIHCNKGKHRTGCVVGCFRKCQGEDLESIYSEYHAYADPKARILDEVFMEIYEEPSVLWLVRQHHWRLPSVETPGTPGPPSPIATLNVARPRA